MSEQKNNNHLKQELPGEIQPENQLYTNDFVIPDDLVVNIVRDTNGTFVDGNTRLISSFLPSDHPALVNSEESFQYATSLRENAPNPFQDLDREEWRWEDEEINFTPEHECDHDHNNDHPEDHNEPLATNISPQSTSSSSNILVDDLITALVTQRQWTLTSERTITFSFYEDDVFGGSYYGIETGVKEVSEGIKINVRNIFDWMESVIDINFIEIEETDVNTFGQIRFQLSDDPQYAFAYYPSSSNTGGDVHLNPYYDQFGGYNDFQTFAGSHGYRSLIHEIGHALGLKHPHDGSLNLSPEWDNTVNTVMSYNKTAIGQGTLMPLDVAALQSMYGASNLNNGDTYYNFSGSIKDLLTNSQFNLVTPYNTQQILWDGGGMDTIDFSQLSFDNSGYYININEGGFLTSQSKYQTTSYYVNGTPYYTTAYGIAIAYNVLIENVINSNSSDEIFLNSAGNRISGYAPSLTTGNDIVWYSNAADTLDLSLYNFANVASSQSGQDLILGLGSNGSITVKNYYFGERINILYGDINTLNLSINDVSVVEGNSGTTDMIFTVSLVGNSTTPISVNYTIAPQTASTGDYSITSTTGTLTFNPGETQKNITVKVNGDTSFEGNETLAITLSNPTGGATIVDGTGIGTILNDDSAPAVSIGDLTVNENGTATVTVSLSSASTQNVTVNYATANGTAIAGSDYTSSNGTVSFNAGETVKTFTVGIINDSSYEPNDETFFINLSNVQNAVIADNQAVVTIKDNDPAPAIGISINDLSLTEGSQKRSTSTKTFSVNVSLSNPSNQTITVQYATANGTATNGSDFIATSGLLTFNPSVTSQTLNIQVYSDLTGEGNENFFINLINPLNATLSDNQGLVTIVNDDLTSGGTGGKGSKSATITSNNLTIASPESLYSSWGSDVTQDNNIFYDDGVNNLGLTDSYGFDNSLNQSSI